MPNKELINNTNSNNINENTINLKDTKMKKNNIETNHNVYGNEELKFKYANNSIYKNKKKKMVIPQII